MPPPEKLEHYELLKNVDGSVMELGHGAMGVTYKAYDTNLQCHVALKVISAAHLNDATAAERFLREARGAAKLRHRNVASVFHLGRHGDSYFYAMEFIEGETVDARVKREGPLDTIFAVETAAQVASALIAAHKQGLVHRDIKPSNLMFVREGDGEMIVKLIDFGLVKSARIGSTGGALTSSGFVGTPYFASPEQLDQRDEDVRSDIYSLGVTLWFMLTGKPTFIGSVASVIAQHLDKTPQFESLAVLPGCVVGVLRKMLEKDVEQRIQSPQELRAELKRCLEILRATSSAGGSSIETIGYDPGLEAVGLSSTHGLQVKIEAGCVLGERYRLIEDLDPAHPGSDFHAEDTQQKRRVHVKAHPCDAAAFAKIEEQVARLRDTSHRNFITPLAASHAGAFGYVISEWLEGFTLLDLLRARRELTLRETLTLLDQIAPAVDAAGGLGVKPELKLRDVMIHFPEGYAELDEEVVLRCPLAEWPVFVVKLDPLASFDDLEASHDSACNRTMVTASQAGCPAVIAQLAALTYDLLGGKPGGFAPLANVSEEGNTAIRGALRNDVEFATARAFVAELQRCAASDTTAHRPPSSKIVRTQTMVPVAVPVAAASAPHPPAAPPSTPPQTRKSSAPPRPFPLPRPVLFGAIAVLALCAIAGFAIFSGEKPAPKPKAPAAPTAAPNQAPAVTAARQPPKTGQPWKNSLDMRYVPLGDIHFSTTETRVKDFAAFVQAKGYDAEGGMYSLQRDGFKQHGHSWKNPGFQQSPEHAVVGISYEDAKYFCDWLTQKERSEGALTAAQFYRLPTDREWSEAAGLRNEPGALPAERSERVKAYVWGSGPLRENAANYAGAEAVAGAPADWVTIARFRDSAPRTAVVPAFGPNARGIYDLGGNVWEWCQDRFNKTTNWRVLRGGSWATSKANELLLSFRRGYDPNFRHDDVGFRCVIATDSGER